MSQPLYRVLAIVIVCGACAHVTEPPDPSSSRRFVVLWSRSAAVCEPNPLPSPIATSGGQYVRLSSSSSIEWLDTLESVEVGETISFSSLTARGTPAFTLTGLPLGNITLNRSGTLTESPRAGGRNFFASETGTGHAEMQSLVLLPPGVGVQTNFRASGPASATFHEGSASGSVYTTCTFTDSISGTTINEVRR